MIKIWYIYAEIRLVQMTISSDVMLQGLISTWPKIWRFRVFEFFLAPECDA